MGSNVSLILSLLFLVNFFVFSSDVINVQYIYANLDAVSQNISYLVSIDYGVTAKALTLAAKSNFTIEYDNTSVALNEPFYYVLIAPYKPFLMNKGELMDIKIQRSVIIGYYN